MKNQAYISPHTKYSENHIKMNQGLGLSMISFTLYTSFLYDLLQCYSLIARKDIVPTPVTVNDFVSFLFSKNCSSPKDRRLRNDLKDFIKKVFEQKRLHIITKNTNLSFSMLI